MTTAVNSCKYCAPYSSVCFCNSPVHITPAGAPGAVSHQYNITVSDNTMLANNDSITLQGMTISNDKLHIYAPEPEFVDMTCPHCRAYGGVVQFYQFNPRLADQVGVKCEPCGASWFMPKGSAKFKKQSELNLNDAENVEDWADEQLLAQLVRALNKNPNVRQQLREALNSTKWYNCAKCEGGYEDQECTCEA